MEPSNDQPTNQPLNPNDQPSSVQPSTPSPNPKPKPLILILVGLALLLLLGGLVLVKLADDNQTTKPKPSPNQGQPPAAVQPSAAVTISATGFTPATIKVKQGQSVTWTNTDAKPHQVASDPFPSEDALPGFKAEDPIAKNETYSFTFNKPGTYTYHDHLTPLTLKATVVVE